MTASIKVKDSRRNFVGSLIGHVDCIKRHIEQRGSYSVIIKEGEPLVNYGDPISIVASQIKTITLCHANDWSKNCVLFLGDIQDLEKLEGFVFVPSIDYIKKLFKDEKS